MIHLTRHLKKVISEDIGWYGMLAILVAYGLSTFGIISMQHFGYQILNLTGSAALAYISWKKSSWQTFALNIIWGIIASISLIQIIFSLS